MNWLVFGAGAIGTYIGGSLALAGGRVTRQGSPAQKVVWVDRPAVAEEVRRRGLRLNLGGEEFSIPQPMVCGSLEEALQQGPFDAALFALKSFDTPAALQGFLPYKDSLPPIVCLSNGVENEPAIQAALGADQVIPATVTSAIGRRGAGDIILERLRGMGVADTGPLARSVAQALSAAGLNARLYASAGEMKWSKMLTNLLANATSAILDMTPAEIFAHPGLCRLEVLQLREALAVMRTLGLKVVDLPGTPVRLLAFGVQRVPLMLTRPLLVRAVGKGRGGKMPSFHIDLHSGRGQSEVDYLNGAVVRFGRQAGVATPANQLLNETLLALSNGQVPLDTYRRQPDKLLGRSI